MNICDDSDETEPDPNIINASRNPPSFPVVSCETGTVNTELNMVHQTDPSVKGGNNIETTENISPTELAVEGGNCSNMSPPTVKGGNRLDNSMIDDSDDDTILLSTPSLDSTVGYVNDIDLEETTFNPISLKQNCIQALSQSVVVS